MTAVSESWLHECQSGAKLRDVTCNWAGFVRVAFHSSSQRNMPSPPCNPCLVVCPTLYFIPILFLLYRRISSTRNSKPFFYTFSSSLVCLHQCRQLTGFFFTWFMLPSNNHFNCDNSSFRQFYCQCLKVSLQLCNMFRLAYYRHSKSSYLSTHFHSANIQFAIL